MTSWRPSSAFRMAFALKSKYRLEIDGIALLLLRGEYERAFSYMRGITYIPFHSWEKVIWAGVLKWCALRSGI